MLTPIMTKYRATPGSLLNLINALNLWESPLLHKDSQELVVATTIWTGVLQMPRPMATLYIAEKKWHQPVRGTIVLIDDTPVDAHPNEMRLRLEGRRFDDFLSGMVLNPIRNMEIKTADYLDIVEVLRENISAHWSETRFKTITS